MELTATVNQTVTLEGSIQTDASVSGNAVYTANSGVILGLDTTLSQSGYAADAASVGQRLQEKVDGAFTEDGYLYLTSNDEVIAGPLGPFSGGVGSGGAYAVTLQSLLESRAITVASGIEVKLLFSYSSVDKDGIDDGSSLGSLFVDGVCKATFDAAQGENTLEVSGYLAAGDNNVKLTVENSEGSLRTLVYTVTVVAAELTSSFDVSAPFTGDILFPYVPTALAEKTVFFELDGQRIAEEVISASGRQHTFTIPAQSHGAHQLRVWFTCEVSGAEVLSNVLYYEFMCLEDGNTAPIIVSSYQAGNVTQYDTVVIPYRVYDPAGLTASVTLLVNGEQTAELEVDRREQVWSWRADSAGEVVLTILCADTRKELRFDVAEAGIEVEAETNSLTLYLSTEGRSNSEAQPGKWEYGEVSAVFTDFNFTSDGWVTDDDGVTVLRVAGDARLEIPLQLFAGDARATGKTIEVEFASRNVMDYDAVLLSCMSGGRGLQITANQAVLASEQSSIGTRYKENEHIRLSFVVEKRSSNRLLLCYINGILSSAGQYPDSDDFSQSSPVSISIGSGDGTIDLYCIRVYENDLTRYQILDNWIADTRLGSVMLQRYSRNRIYDAYGRIAAGNLPKDLPYLILEAAELPQYKGDKKTISGTYTDPANTSRSFAFTNAQIDVQGTSSQYYSRKNYRIKFKSGFTLADGSVVSGYAMNDDAVETSTFTFKADVASSEGANNVELVRLYDDANPYRTPPQLENERVRQGIDGFPIVLFWSDGEQIQFMGKYNFNNDKSTSEVFGLDDDDESWEILNNTSDRVIWKSDDFSGSDWLNDFEARHPEDNEDASNLQKLASWLKSTDQSAATGEDLGAYVTLCGEIFNQDTPEYRLAKFVGELEQYFDVDALVFNYLFTELFLLVDNRAKNAFPTRYDGGKWTLLPYDYDTALGTNNEGSLAFDYDLEDIDQTDSGADVYNGQDSVLFVNTRQGLYDRIMAMYQQLRSNGILSYEDTRQRFEDHQSKWPEAVFNEDAYYKYLQPLTDEGSAIYLPMCQGSKTEQRKWWLYNRFRYLDSKYQTGDAMTDYVTIRGYAKSDITVTPYASIYAMAKFGSYLVSERARKGGSYTLACPLDNVNDTEIMIFSASQIADFGDLSGFMVGLADFSAATRMRGLKLGDGAQDYSNANLTDLTLGNNVLLQTLDVRNCPNLVKAVDVSGCTGLEYAYFEGTSITGLSLPNGGIVKTLHLPGTVTNLTVRNQPKLTEFELESAQNLTTLWLENCNGIPACTLVQNAPDLARVRLLGVDWTLESGDLLDLLLSCGGVDENGHHTAQSVITGKCSLTAATQSKLDTWKTAWPELEITVEGVITEYTVTFCNYDGTVLCTLLTPYREDAGDPVALGLIDTPARPMDAQYTYTFTGWDGSLSCVEENRTLTAQFSTTVNQYTVRFVNGTTILETIVVEYGGAAAYSGGWPLYSGDAPEEWIFTGWSENVDFVDQDMDACAQFTYLEVPDAVMTLEEMSWSQILAVARKGYAGATEDGDPVWCYDRDGTEEVWFAIGDEKTFVLSDGQEYKIQIWGFEYDEKAAGGKAPITFGMVHLTEETCKTGCYSAGKSWADTNMRTILRETVYPKLPSELMPMIVTVKKETLYVPSGEVSGMVTTSDTLFVPSVAELNGKSNYGYEEDAPAYPAFTNNASRIRYAFGSETPAEWYTRTMIRYNSTLSGTIVFYMISAGGGVSTPAVDSTRAICFGFCIG